MDEYLRDVMRARRWTIPQLAEACDVATGLAQKWVSPNPRNRSIPSPDSCAKIADALGVDPDYVLELAGHRKPRGDKTEADKSRAEAFLARRQQSLRDARDRWVAAVGPKMGEDAADEYFWADLAAHADLTLDLYERMESAVSEPSKSAVSGAVSDRKQRPPDHRRDSGGPLTRHQHRRIGIGRRLPEGLLQPATV